MSTNITGRDPIHGKAGQPIAKSAGSIDHSQDSDINGKDNLELPSLVLELEDSQNQSEEDSPVKELELDDSNLTNNSQSLRVLKNPYEEGSPVKNTSSDFTKSPKAGSKNGGAKCNAKTGSRTKPESSKDSSRNHSARSHTPARPKSTTNFARKRSWKTFIWITVIVAAVILGVIFQNFSGNSERTCAYSNLNGTYGNETVDLWQHLQTGIENILNGNSRKPAVYLFVHSGTKTAKKLIKDIAHTSSSCLDSSKPVEIEKNDFKNAEVDYGHIIENYKQKIKEGNVILVANLNEIPPKAARALHSICDTATPLVPKVVIFLSLVAEHKEGKVVETAENALRTLWESTIHSHELDPLITRVTDEVLLLQSK